MNPHTSLARFEDQPLADDQLDDWLFLSYESSGSIVPEHLEVNRDTQEAEDRGKLKTKLVSAWNSVKYGWSWKQKSKFSKDSPVIMLGHSYELKDQEERELFRCSFASLLWLTYRRGFPQLADGILTTDSGWGCVLRTGQMLLAKGLLLHLMPPGWTWHVSHRAARDDMDPLVIRATDSPEHVLNSFKGPSKRGRRLSLDSHLDRSKEASHRQVVSWFADYPTAPFGIHNLVQLGRSSGKKAGDWYGPSIVAHILRKAVAGLVDLPNLTVYVAQDCTVYLQDVKSLCERPPPQPWKSVIILVPVRLGGQNLNPSYITYVKKLLTLQCCIGIIGGKPKHSLYFVGFQDDHLLYLDPHYCQPTVDITKENFPLESFHCKHPRKMSFSRMDPSCTIGFYAKCKKDFEFLCKVVHEALSTSKETYPMFIFAEGNSQEDEEKTPTNSTTYIQRRSRRSEARLVNTNNSLDEFVLL